MTALSANIKLSGDAREEWSSLVASSAPALLELAIDKESVVIKSHHPAGDFELLSSLVSPDEARYFLLRQASDERTFIFYSYVPDHAPVRQKMLYASSQSNLLRALGNTHVKTSIFATTKEDLTESAYAAHTRHISSSAPLTAREEEQAAMRIAELDVRASTGGRSMLHSTGGSHSVTGLACDNDASSAMQEVVGATRNTLYLKIEKETIVLGEQPATLALPTSTPCYLFIRIDSRIAFVYSCPSTSPIKSRMIYASSVAMLLQHAKSLGLAVDTKIETSDPSEITLPFILEELGPQLSSITDSSSEHSAAVSNIGGELSFARPSRPGRKR